MTTWANRLKRHPFAVTATLDRVIALTFAFPEELLRPLLPAPLKLDGYEGFGFVTVALVWTRQLRPAVLPEWAGRDFFLAGYRIFARLEDESGRRLRGLKILGSETDRESMVWSGNLMTHYQYRQIRLEASVSRLRTFRLDGPLSLDFSFDAGAQPDKPPAGSPFPDWRTARQFAGPMPFTFEVEPDGSCVIIEGKRQGWAPRPLAVTDWMVALFSTPPFNGATPVLANAFQVENVPYRWEKGRVLKPFTGTGGA